MTSSDKATVPSSIDIGLNGTTAVVFGAGPGIGRATASLFAAAGCRVIAVDLELSIAEATRMAVGTQVDAAQVDVTDRSAVCAFFDGLVEAGTPPCTVVDVVGIARPKSVADTTDDDWAVMQQLNLAQQFIVAQESAKVLTRPGSYVAVASINGVVSSPQNAAYGAAKAGLISLMRSLALEMATDDVRFNAVAPGIVDTPRLRAFFEATGRRDEFSGAVPMGRVAQPEDIAGAIALLASPLAGYVTGQVLAVDGGAAVKYPLALMG